MTGEFQSSVLLLNPDFKFIILDESDSKFSIIERKDTGFEIAMNVTGSFGYNPYMKNVLDEEPLSIMLSIPLSNQFLTRFGAGGYTFQADSFLDQGNVFRDRNTFFVSQSSSDQPILQFVDCGSDTSTFLDSFGFCDINCNAGEVKFNSQCMGCIPQCVVCDLNGNFVDVDAVCKSCIANCITCSNSITCEVCDAQNNYANDGSGGCRQCDPSQNEYFDNGTCSICDLNGTFFENNECKACIANCNTCSDTTTCSACDAQNNYANDGSGGCSICNLVGNFIENNECRSCLIYCLTCSDATTCSACDVQNNYVDDGSGGCSICGPIGKFIDNNTCRDCLPNCITCTNSTICQVCDQNNNFFLSNI